MKRILWLDLETFSTIPLKHGVYKYAEQAEVLLFTYALDDGEVGLWDVASGDETPEDLMLALADENFYLAAHKANFDRTILQLTELCPINYYNLDPSRWICTMTQAYCHNLPGALELLGTMFGLDEAVAKDKYGKRLIHLFCKPHADGTRATPETHPAEWEKFKSYAKQDIVAMRALHKLMPKWNYPGVKFLQGELSNDHALCTVDSIINSRGYALDLALADRAVEAATRAKSASKEAMMEQTDNELDKAAGSAKLLKYILGTYGVSLPNLQADTVQRQIDNDELPMPLRELLAERLKGSKNTGAKYKAARQACSFDGRLRGTLQFRGAALTGRYSGRIFQPQNLMRPTMEPEDIDIAIDDVKSGAADLVYPDMPKILGNCVRGLIVAPEGSKLLVSDLSAIEGRILAWLAGDERIVQFYRDFDAGKIGYDSYILAYAQAFGKDPTTMSKKTHGKERQLGKPIELSLGYGGGVSAFVTFAQTYHINIAEIQEAVYAVATPAAITDCEAKYVWALAHGFTAGLPRTQYAACEYIKRKWREARLPTTQFWDELQNAWATVCQTEGEVATVGMVKFLRTGQWLRIRLPSGRNLCFLQPKYTTDGASFMGLNSQTRQWQRTGTHGGKLAGWITQATANDLLNDGLLQAEDEGMLVVLTVHDEIVSEVSLDSGKTVKDLERCMTAPRVWTTGLPLVADGFETLRYRK